jgi:GTP-binding protein
VSAEDAAAGDRKMSLTVAIVGRPNVGKSTLFNRLVGARRAIVDARPGVTRDRRESEARLGDLRFTVIDTAGFDEVRGEGLEARMQAQTERAVAEADVTLFLIDARAGITPLDRAFAARLRTVQTPVILIANKCEGRGGGIDALEAFSLGFGEPAAISAEHGDGMADLYAALRPFADAAASGTDSGDHTVSQSPRAIQLAVVGRPNVGKSTLINRLVGEERLVTAPEAGTTRDAITVGWSHGGRDFRLVDTAGLRRRARISDRLEELSVADSLRAIRFAEVVVIVLDATQGLEKQDLMVARLVVDEGRAPVIAVNKWDLIDDRAGTTARIRQRLEESLPQVRGVRTVPVSAITGHGMDRLLSAVREVVDVWNKRVATAAVNRWLASAVERHPPPLIRGHRLKLRYISQIKERPPTFALFAGGGGDLPDDYERYLVNGLRDAFDLTGVPIRLLLRRGRNPFVDRRQP